MICKNCGAKIRNKESYCPRCGMELFNFDNKPLQKKFLRGEYRDEEETTVEPYNLEGDDSKDSYQKETYQNWDDYDPDSAHGYEEDKVQDYEHNTDQFNADQDHAQEKVDNQANKNYNQEKSNYRDYDENKDYDNKYNQEKSSRKKYNKKGYRKQKKYPTKVYDLDEYESKPKKSSIWGTVILFLVLALLIGFVMGFIFFSGKIQNLFS